MVEVDVERVVLHGDVTPPVNANCTAPSPSSSSAVASDARHTHLTLSILQGASHWSFEAYWWGYEAYNGAQLLAPCRLPLRPSGRTKPQHLRESAEAHRSFQRFDTSAPWENPFERSDAIYGLAEQPLETLRRSSSGGVPSRHPLTSLPEEIRREIRGQRQIDSSARRPDVVECSERALTQSEPSHSNESGRRGEPFISA